MKKIFYIISVVTLVFVGYMFGQSYGKLSIGQISPLVTNCPSPDVGSATFCPVGSGTSFQTYVSYNGGAYAPLNQPFTVPVTTVFGRTGDIKAQSGDYNYSQLSSPPTSISCPNASLSSGTTGTLNATGCTIK